MAVHRRADGGGSGCLKPHRLGQPHPTYQHSASSLHHRGARLPQSDKGSRPFALPPPQLRLLPLRKSPSPAAEAEKETKRFSMITPSTACRSIPTSQLSVLPLASLAGPTIEEMFPPFGCLVCIVARVNNFNQIFVLKQS
jgi:hypothetical protein